VVNVKAPRPKYASHRLTTWDRVRHAILRHADKDGWIGRANLTNRANVGVDDFIQAVTEHWDELEVRIVDHRHQGPSREEYRLR
jgi:hypothetical protein